MRVTEPYTIFLRTLPSGKQVYYYQFRDEQGHRSNARSTGCTKLTAAKRYCQQLYNKGELKRHSGVLFKDYTKDFFAKDGAFCQWKKVNGNPLKAESARRYTNLLKGQLLPYFENVAVSAITRDLCKEWVLWANGKWSPKTVNTAQGVLGIILESAVEKKLIDSNPVSRLGLRKLTKKSRELLSEDEIRAIYQAKWKNQAQRTMFLLAAITGMRIGEIVALHKNDIKEGFLDVHADYSDKFGYQTSTKTYVNRYVPIPYGFSFPESSSEWVFLAKDGGPIKGHAIYNAVMRKCEELGIDTSERGITMHSLRNFFISYLQKENVPESKIRAVVGHTDETMTDVYTYWKPDMFPEVYGAQERLFKSITEVECENQQNN